MGNTGRAIPSMATAVSPTKGITHMGTTIPSGRIPAIIILPQCVRGTRRSIRMARCIMLTTGAHTVRTCIRTVRFTGQRRHRPLGARCVHGVRFTQYSV